MSEKVWTSGVSRVFELKGGAEASLIVHVNRPQGVVLQLKPRQVQSHAGQPTQEHQHELEDKPRHEVFCSGRNGQTLFLQ